MDLLKYERTELDITEFDFEDVISTSFGGGGGASSGTEDPNMNPDEYEGGLYI